MKWIGNIFILTLIWIICGARSCSNESNIKEPQEKKLLSASKDSIKQAFEVDSPNDQLLKAYEATGMQKLTDFADYLKIACDSSLDIKFRQQAAEMAAKLFVPGEIDTRNWSKVFHEYNLNTLDRLLIESMKKGLPCRVQPDQVKVIRPLIRKNDSTFKGRLSFDYECIPFGKPIRTENLSGRLEIDIYALKKVKSFGQEQLRVWNVYLGNIN